MLETEKIGREFDQDACDFCDRYAKQGLSRSSRLLCSFIVDEGIEGKSVADLGCGAGGFSIELLKKGASTAVGFDLSEKMIETANRLAKTNGFESRAKFRHGNAASVDIPQSDIVLMDKVLCCYSEWELLLNNAIRASNAMFCLIVPRAEGITKPCFRIGVKITNFFLRRKGGVLFYLHPLNEIDMSLRSAGFETRKKRGSRLWLVFLYSRTKQVEDALNTKKVVAHG